MTLITNFENVYSFYSFIISSVEKYQPVTTDIWAA